MPPPSRRGILQGAGIAAAAAAGLPTQATAAAAAQPFQQQGSSDAPYRFCQFYAHCNPQPRNGPYAHLPRSAAAEVIAWYQTHRYEAAVAQTGLNVFTPVGGLQATYDLPGEFLVVPSEEVSRIPDGLAPDGIAPIEAIEDVGGLPTFNAC
jgi:hypothetical protein